MATYYTHCRTCEAEVVVEITRFTPATGAYFSRSFGNYLPPEPAEAEWRVEERGCACEDWVGEDEDSIEADILCAAAEAHDDYDGPEV
jgi:hypothetical protein